MWIYFVRSQRNRICPIFMMWGPTGTKGFAMWHCPKRDLHDRVKYCSVLTRTPALPVLSVSLQQVLATRMQRLLWAQENCGRKYLKPCGLFSEELLSRPT